MMRTTNVMRMTAAAAAVGLLLSACGSDGSAAPVADGGTEAGTLDAGDFPTTPQPEFGAVSPEDAAWIESQRMAEFVTMPFEIDPELSDPGGSSRPFEDAADTNSLLTTAGSEAIEGSFVAGFNSAATTPDENNKRELSTAVIRLEDPAAVGAALPAVKDALIAGESEPSVEDPIDILPNTTVVSQVIESDRNPEPSVSVTAVTPHNEYLLVASAWTAESDKEWTAQTIATFVDQQVPLIDQFPATPVEEIPNITMDQDHVLIYTVPQDDGQISARDQAVYGPRGTAITANNFPRSYQRLLDSNVEHVAISNTTVYETGSAEDAEQLIAGFVEDSLAVESTVETTPPAGLEQASCFESELYGKTCLIANGNYVGQVSMSVPEDAQKLAAQYLILDHAK